MEDLVIRKGCEEDAREISEIEKLCFKTPWSLEAILEDMTRNDLSTYLVAIYQGKIAGYIGIWNIVGEGHINNVAVAPSYRRQGIGSSLLKELITREEKEGIKMLTLEVRASNEEAISLYEKFSFKKLGFRKGYYTDTNEDAIIMWRE